MRAVRAESLNRARWTEEMTSSGSEAMTDDRDPLRVFVRVRPAVEDVAALVGLSAQPGTRRSRPSLSPFCCVWRCLSTAPPRRPQGIAEDHAPVVVHADAPEIEHGMVERVVQVDAPVAAHFGHVRRRHFGPAVARPQARCDLFAAVLAEAACRLVHVQGRDRTIDRLGMRGTDLGPSVWSSCRNVSGRHRGVHLWTQRPQVSPRSLGCYAESIQDVVVKDVMVKGADSARTGSQCRSACSPGP